MRRKWSPHVGFACSPAANLAAQGGDGLMMVELLWELESFRAASWGSDLALEIIGVCTSHRTKCAHMYMYRISVYLYYIYIYWIFVYVVYIENTFKTETPELWIFMQFVCLQTWAFAEAPPGRIDLGFLHQSCLSTSVAPLMTFDYFSSKLTRHGAGNALRMGCMGFTGPVETRINVVEGELYHCQSAKPFLMHFAISSRRDTDAERLSSQ